MTLEGFRLEDRLETPSGSVALSGIQALLRILIDQHRADAAAGIRTATLLSGYRGSPVGGVDTAFAQNERTLAAHDVHFLNGLNEDLAATAVWGAQMAGLMKDPTFDGVMGMWYGKGPGVDRSGDALRHANFAGVDPNGGVICVAGDDPACKSSTLPSASEYALADLAMPILYPGSVQEVVDHGRIAYEMSRYSGLWVALKIHTDVADAYATVAVGPDRVRLERPAFAPHGEPWSHQRQPNLIAPWSVEREREVYTDRTEAARAFARHNAIDTHTISPGAWIGIVAAGKPYHDVMESLAELGVDDPAELGIRIFRPTMISPLDPVSVRRFAAGLEEILVVEEKRGFIEDQVRVALYDSADRPVVVGKLDDDGRPLLPVHGALEASIVTPALRSRLRRRISADRLVARTRIPVEVAGSSLPARTPFFCSGCPHNRSTALPEGSTAGGGIGCHGMVLLIPSRPTEGITHMGGEGAQWVGAEPFVGEAHRFQNLGDGTLFHSGSLAIRQAVSAGTNVTYKILYNGVVAMTGGQASAGEMPVPELTRMLEAEGVARTIVVSDDPRKYPSDARFAANATVRHRDQLDDAQRELRDIGGVTVLVYDQACAADLRRARSRGRAKRPDHRIFINEAVCEGCGHCGEISNCLSVHPVDTPFGTKTQIHQESCNFDFTCVDGNCPAFVKVVPGTSRANASPAPVQLDEPEEPVERLEEANVLLIGIGGTGVVTANQLLATAALLDGRHATSLDQTGLSQKGGPVVSNLKITTEPVVESNRIGLGATDAYLVFDLLAGSNAKNLARADRARTVAVVSTGRVPTGAMVTRRSRFPELQRFHDAIDPVTADRSVWFDADALARTLFRSQAAANVIILGAAYQLGLLPISAAAMHKAIELNGVAVDMNLQAFRIGRTIVADPEAVTALAPNAPTEPSSARPSVPSRLQHPDDLAAVVERWITHLTGYQDAEYATRYVSTIERVRDAEDAIGAHGAELTIAVAEHLGKLMAYKDEYEVARLHLDPDFRAELEHRFGIGARPSYLLQPPILNRFGLTRKIELPRRVADPAFRALCRMRRVRGTALDPFGRTAERRIERALIDEYEAVVGTLLEHLTPETHADAVTIACLPDVVRGYDEIKLRNVAHYRERLAELMDAYLGR